ncbi:hypothetical protein CMI48_01100 [Candidatus Pacearchaeota archaeon]|nr:hypothetical protein [Candidatus Pacearchaeota archaeon]
MIMIDALYHLATETAVHLHYILVKIFLIFLILFLTTYWIGKGRNQGIFVSIAGPFIFYIYYVFADPTLNRNVFRIGESFAHMFLHIAVFAISYAIVYNYLTNRGDPQTRNLATAFALSLMAYGLDAMYQLSKDQIQTYNAEISATTLHFSGSLYLVALFMITSFLCFSYIKNTKVQALTFVIVSLIGIFIVSHSLTRTLTGIITVGLPLLLINYYLHNNEEVIA